MGESGSKVLEEGQPDNTVPLNVPAPASMEAAWSWRPWDPTSPVANEEGSTRPSSLLVSRAVPEGRDPGSERPCMLPKVTRHVAQPAFGLSSRKLDGLYNGATKIRADIFKDVACA